MKIKKVKRPNVSHSIFQNAAHLALDVKQQQCLKGGYVITEDAVML